MYTWFTWFKGERSKDKLCVSVDVTRSLQKTLAAALLSSRHFPMFPAGKNRSMSCSEWSWRMVSTLPKVLATDKSFFSQAYQCWNVGRWPSMHAYQCQSKLLPDEDFSDCSLNDHSGDIDDEQARLVLAESWAQERLGERNSKARNTRTCFLGIALLAFSGAVFATCGLLVKLSDGVPAFEQGFFRCLLQLAFTLPLVVYFDEHPPPFGPRDKLPWILARGLFGVVGMCCQYYAMKRLPIGETTVLVFTAPIFTGIIARLWVKEPWGLFEVGASILSLAGVLLIARPRFLFPPTAATFDRHNVSAQAVPLANLSAEHISTRSSDGHNPVAVCAALAAAVFAALSYVAARKIGQKVSFLVVTMYFGVVGLPVTALITTASHTWAFVPTLRDGACVLAIGVLSSVGQSALNKGLSMERAVIAAMIRNVDIVLAFVYQVAIFGEAVSVWSALGTVLILTSTVSISWKRYKEESKTWIKSKKKIETNILQKKKSEEPEESQVNARLLTSIEGSSTAVVLILMSMTSCVTRLYFLTTHTYRLADYFEMLWKRQLFLFTYIYIFSLSTERESPFRSIQHCYFCLSYLFFFLTFCDKQIMESPWASGNKNNRKFVEFSCLSAMTWSRGWELPVSVVQQLSTDWALFQLVCRTCLL